MRIRSYMLRALELLESVDDSGAIVEMEIKHDADCRLLESKGADCTCRPDITIRDVHRGPRQRHD